MRRAAPAAPSAPSAPAAPAPAALVAVAALALAAVAVVVRLQPAGPVAARLVDDLAQAVAAAVAAACCVRRARSASAGGTASSWWWYAAATGAWAVGQLAWTWDEVVAHGPGHFPSPWDVCFLLFPVLGSVGLLRWPLVEGRGALRWRALLDGVLVAAALFVVAWNVAVRTPAGAGTDLLASGVALVAPGCDLVHLSLAVVVLSHTRRARSGLGVLVVGLVGLWATNWTFAVLVAAGRWGTGTVVDLGWVATMLVVAAAALRREPERPATDEPPMASTACALLPYAAATLGLAVALADRLEGHDDRVTTGAAAVVVAALLVRQLLAVLEHRALVHRVLATRDELEHRALHDPLTALANRTLLDRRLREGLEDHRRERRGLSLLYVDLDDFKDVNDALGHDAGDLVLQEVAGRLRATVRSGDTVARLGGDEFAVLLREADDPSEVATRIAAALAEPLLAGPVRVVVGASIGSTVVTPDEPTPTAPAVLRRADGAMYDVKRAVRRVAASAWSAPTPTGVD